ncbi:hypothetical protein [Thalassotalea atypica]|uniref:hypothetical protein n=1 Tax=Thalassotalea atypica TaxID=2054316 RepID=UPI0025736194|nr:hypothetical protein [Thalassotalea atypica]
MGTAVQHWSFSKENYQAFQEKLYLQLDQLKDVIESPSFGDEPLKMGAELEMYITDDKGLVSSNNLALLTSLNDNQFQPELNQYNIELNLSPVDTIGKPFSRLHQEIDSKTLKLKKVAKKHKVKIVPIGILPTLTQEHLNIAHMTNVPRYHNLANHLYEKRGKAFEININGKEPLSITFNDICAEGANTSFQVHLMTKPERFSSVFNAAQLTAPLVAAIAANSPVFLGNELWDETRIALFKQSLDIRLREQTSWQQPTRVNFGFGWVRNGPLELFAEAVSLYPIILPSIDDSPAEGNLPKLTELSTHMGTLWPWHRPVYSNHGKGHVRIEFRAIPAGPTNIDMVANAAFAIGLANGLADNIEQYLNVIPFRFAEYNFYRAAQHGIHAKILWPLENKHHPTEVAIKTVLNDLIPTARKGLLDLGIEYSDVDTYLNIIEQRLNNEITGAIWQKRTLESYRKTQTKDKAAQSLVIKYLANSQMGLPVSQWEQPWL